MTRWEPPLSCAAPKLLSVCNPRGELRTSTFTPPPPLLLIFSSTWPLYIRWFFMMQDRWGRWLETHSPFSLFSLSRRQLSPHNFLPCHSSTPLHLLLCIPPLEFRSHWPVLIRVRQREKKPPKKTKASPVLFFFFFTRFPPHVRCLLPAPLDFPSSSSCSSSSFALQSAGSQADSTNWFFRTHLNSYGDSGDLWQ